MAKVYAEPVSSDPPCDLKGPSRLIRSERVSRGLVGPFVTFSLFLLLLLTSELLSMAGLSLLNWFTFKEAQTQYEHLKFYQDKPWARQYWKEFLQAQRFKFEPYVAWRRRAFAGRYVNVDTNGIRRTDNPECSPTSRKIWMFGASNLWGTGAKDDETISSILSQEHARSVGSICIVNFGEDAWVSTQEIILLELELKRNLNAPDLVLFFGGMSDEDALVESHREDGLRNFEELRKKVEKDKQKAGLAYLTETNLYRLIEALAVELLRQKHENQTSDTQTSATPLSAKEVDRDAHMAAHNYLGNIRLLQSLSEHYDFRYIVFWAPAVFLGNKPLGPRERRLVELSDPAASQLARETRDLVFLAGDKHIVGLTDVFDHTLDEVYIDAGHTNPIGNRLIAKRMLEAIKTSGVESAVRKPPTRALAAVQEGAGVDEGVTLGSEH